MKKRRRLLSDSARSFIFSIMVIDDGDGPAITDGYLDRSVKKCTVGTVWDSDLRSLEE